MRITGIIWLRSVVEKLQGKHQVSQIEVEEVLQGKPRVRRIERADVAGEDSILPWGRHMAVVT